MCLYRWLPGVGDGAGALDGVVPGVGVHLGDLCPSGHDPEVITKP